MLEANIHQTSLQKVYYIGYKFRPYIMNKIAAGNFMFSDVHKHVKLHVRTYFIVKLISQLLGLFMNM